MLLGVYGWALEPSARPDDADYDPTADEDDAKELATVG